MMIIKGKRSLRIVVSVSTMAIKTDESIRTMMIADTTLTALFLLTAKTKSAIINKETLNIFIVNIMFYLLSFTLMLFDIIPQKR